MDVIPGVRGKRGRPTPAADRMWRRVVEQPSGCLMFTGALDGHGYGQVADMVRGQPAKAHRLAWESRVGPIPDGMTIDHLCTNKRCVNVQHLELVTRSENGRRGTAMRSRKLVCKNGHVLPLPVTDAERVCRLCRALNNRRYRQRLKERAG